MSNDKPTNKKEPKGTFDAVKNFVTEFGVVKYSVYTKHSDGSKSLVRKSITERGALVDFIPFSELAEVVPLITPGK